MAKTYLKWICIVICILFVMSLALPTIIASSEDKSEILENARVKKPSGFKGIQLHPKVEGEGYILSKNSDYSTDDRQFTNGDTMYMKIWSNNVIYNNMKKAEYEIKVVLRVKGKLTNNNDGTFTGSKAMSQFSPGSGTVKLKLEDQSRNKFEVKNIAITVTDTVDTTPPAQVTGLTVTTNGSTRLDLSWNGNTESDLDHYNVHRSTSPGTGFSMIASPTVNTYTDTGLSASTTYYYKVTAVDTSSNEGQASSEVSETTAAPDTTPPTKITGLTVTTASSSQLDLSWNANTESDLDHYKIYRSTTSGSGFTSIASPTTNSYSDTGLEPATTYYYKVTAVDKSSNEGVASDETAGTTEEGISGEGYILSKNADFSTDDRELLTTDTMYMKIWSNRIDHTNMRKAEYQVKVGGIRKKGSLTNNNDGTFTGSISMSQLPAGSGEAKLKLEDNYRIKYEESTQVTITTPPAPNKWAVIIGISDYQGTGNDLQYCDDDAMDMYNYLLSKGYAESNIRLLLDDDATGNAIYSAIDWMDANEDSASECVFFYSGHGSTYDGYDDGDSEDTDETIVTWGLYLILDGFLRVEFATYASQKIAFIFDSCYGGGMDDLVGAHTSTTYSDRVVITPCKEDQLSYDGSSQMQNGVFTYYYMQELDIYENIEDAFTYAAPKAHDYMYDTWDEIMDPQIYDLYFGKWEF